ncbi:MAG TPA: hypothetical protein VIN11_00620, partial [Roseivirga sp.]
MAQDFSLKSKYEFSDDRLNGPIQIFNKARLTPSAQEKAQIYESAALAYERVFKEALDEASYELAINALLGKADMERRYLLKERPLSTLSLARDLLKDHISTESLLWAEVYYTIGVVHHRSNDMYSARDYLDSAHLLYTQSEQYDTTLYSNLVDYKFYAHYYSNGNVDTLLKYLKIRVDLEEIKQSKESDPTELLYIKQDFPRIYSSKGEYDLALAYAISNYKFLQESRSIPKDMYYDVIYDLSVALNRKQEFQKSLEVVLKSYGDLEMVGLDDQFDNITYLIGSNYSSLNMPSEALKYFEKLIERRPKQTQSVQRQVFRSGIQLYMGLCYSQLGNESMAQFFLRESLESLKRYLEPPNASFINHYRYLGDFNAQKGNWVLALNNYDSALRNTSLEYNQDLLIFPKVDSVQKYSLVALEVLTKKAQALGNVESSDVEEDPRLVTIQYVDETQKALIQNRRDFIQQEGKLYLSLYFKQLYEIGIKVCYSLYSESGDSKYLDKAFQYSQMSKANLFLEQSQEYQQVINPRIPKEIKQSFYQFKTRLDYLKSLLYAALDNSVTSDSVIRLNEDILISQDSLQRIENELVDYNLQVDYSDDKSNRKVVVGPKEVLVEYFYGNDMIYIIWQTKDDEGIVELNIDQSLKQNLDALIDIINKP